MQQLSRDKFDRFPRATTEFTLCVLDRYGLRDHSPARPTLTPQIRFLYIGSRFCSTLPSDPASQRRPCASLSLHLYQVVKRTYTSRLSNMLGVRKGKGVRLDALEIKPIHHRRIADRAQPICWGCSARFCLISFTLSTRSSACLRRAARSSADSTISALRR